MTPVQLIQVDIVDIDVILTQDSLYRRSIPAV